MPARDSHVNLSTLPGANDTAPLSPYRQGVLNAAEGA
jgi:hypothetical protein